jgi:hypothetical protein
LPISDHFWLNTDMALPASEEAPLWVKIVPQQTESKRESKRLQHFRSLLSNALRLRLKDVIRSHLQTVTQAEEESFIDPPRCDRFDLAEFEELLSEVKHAFRICAGLFVLEA